MSIKAIFRYCLICLLTLSLASTVAPPLSVQARTESMVYLPLVLRQERIVINFDNLSVPTNFKDTTALRGEYIDLGVYFSSEGTYDGGGVLQEFLGSWVDSGFSFPNILGFNSSSGSNFSDGGMPVTPQYIEFAEPVSYVEAKFGSKWSVGQTITMSAYDESDTELAWNYLILAAAMQTIGIRADGISYIIITSSGEAFAMDDLVIIK
jgi:hypothetical protein